MGGELSKCEGVPFHWWLFSSKRNDKLRPFYPDINLIGTSKHHKFVGCRFETVFHYISFHFEGVPLAVRGCTCMLKGCSRTLKTPNSPPLGAGLLARGV